MRINPKSFHQATGQDVQFVQDHHSRSGKGVLRVVRGAVDIRTSLPTFEKRVGVELTELNHRQFWIPAGFAHGFVALSDTADLLYKTTDYYAPEHERCTLWNDPAMAILWLLEGNPVLSAIDLQGPSLADAEHVA